VINIIDNIKLEIKQIITKAVNKAQQKEQIPTIEMPEISIEIPREKEHGDFSTNIAMLITKQVKKPPRQTAEILIKNMELKDSYARRVECAGPGFINFYLSNDWLYHTLEAIQKCGDSYGKSDLGKGQKVMVEFVSANPTGPLHMGNARGGALGDCIASVLKASGYHVEKEFYVNDAGNQIEKFAISLEARYIQILKGEDAVEFPEDGYHGEDIVEHMRDFIVQYPTIEIGEITWEPQETMFADGTSLNFEASITNNSPVAITQKFNVNFTVDSMVIRTQIIDGLKAGETKKITARWAAKEKSDGTRNIAAVIVDPEGKVLETEGLTKSVTLPVLRIIYPNLHISTVNWSPIDGTYNSPVTFTASIANDSLATIFKRFTIGLYVREAGSTDSFKQVAGYVVEGLRGYSSAFVPLTWSPDKAGQYEFKIMTDIYGEVKQQPITEENNKNRAYTNQITVKDRLVMKAYPSEEDADDDILAVLYSSSDRVIPISAQFYNSANPGVSLSPDDGIISSYTLKSGAVVVSEGQLNYSYALKKFTMDIPTAMLDTGTYILEIAGTDGGTALTSTVNIRIVQDVLAFVNTDKKLYNLGESVKITGNMSYRDGTPMANEQVVLDLMLMPELSEPRVGRDSKGNEILLRYQGEHIRFLRTDQNGNFEYEFYPIAGEAGKWNIAVYALQRLLGNAATNDFAVLGMTVEPSNLSLTAGKNSSFSKTIVLKNAALAGDNSLTGITAVLSPVGDVGNVTATLDKSTFSTTLGANSQTSVTLNFNAPIDAPDTVTYKVTFSSAQGATATSNITLYLRPATPIPITDPKGIKVALNPGATLTKTVKVTNKGLGVMNGIYLEQPSAIPWITAKNLSAISLMPGQSATFDIVFSPNQSTGLGQYQDSVVVTNGQYKAVVTVAAELTSANVGDVTFVVMDDTGSRVPNADVVLVSTQSYVHSVNGIEQIYYQNFSGRTDASGVVTLTEKPLGLYNYTISAAGRKKIAGQCDIMPGSTPSVVNVTMESLPVQIEWTVIPTTIQDEYEVKLDLVFGANIPTPSFGFVPPWINIPKQVESEMIVEAQVINTGLISLTDVTAQVRRANAGDTGISIVGGGYIGEIPAHGSVRIQLLVQPGYYNLLYENPAKNFIFLKANYVSFDADTGLPETPAKGITGMIPLYNPSQTEVSASIQPPGSGTATIEKFKLPEGQMEELDYLLPPPSGGPGGDSGEGGSVYEIVKLTLNQTATLERQAFDATLRISNGYPAYALQNLSVNVMVVDEEGKDVTSSTFVIPMGVQGMSSLDGSGSLSAGKSMTGQWQIVPGDGLGGDSPAGKTYYAKANISYYVNGKLVETQTDSVPIVIVPQPKITLNYFVPQKILSGVPFKLGVVAENSGKGYARNLIIDSGKLEITTNQAGLLTEFEIIGGSFGTSAGGGFRLNLGDIEPEKSVSGYWLVRWKMYEEEEGARPYEGEFREFSASLTHKDYMGVELNPLIIKVNTEIIGKDGFHEVQPNQRTLL
jgi:hypothetical protein